MLVHPREMRDRICDIVGGAVRCVGQVGRQAQGVFEKRREGSNQHVACMFQAVGIIRPIGWNPPLWPEYIRLQLLTFSHMRRLKGDPGHRVEITTRVTFPIMYNLIVLGTCG